MLDRALTLYELLGVEPSASSAEIIAAFRVLAARYHPRQHPTCHLAPILYGALIEARDTLLDLNRRARYDAALARVGEPPAVSRIPAAPPIPDWRESVGGFLAAIASGRLRRGL